MSELVLYHGSPAIISQPIFGYGSPYNDYGRGFYCTQNLELAKEWASSEGGTGYANCYRLDADGLSILDIGEYSVLHWLSVLVTHRVFQTTSPVVKAGKRWLMENYSLPLEGYDLVKGYRADDSYFSFARAFLSNQISYQQLEEAMKAGNLGEQIALKSEKAFQRITYCFSEEVDCGLWFASRRNRDLKARENYIALLDKGDANGLYIRDLMKGDVPDESPRL